jgi:hypothetical protein
MSESLLNEFAKFFDDLPQSVRDDLSFMLLTLTDENIVRQDLEISHSSAARELFQAQTRIGRIGNLINAVSVFDIYFAMDERERFLPNRKLARRNSHGGGNVDTSSKYGCYADQVGAIQTARQHWHELRRTALAAGAIAAALIPPEALRVRRGLRREERVASHDVSGCGASDNREEFAH